MAEPRPFFIYFMVLLQTICFGMFSFGLSTYHHHHHHQQTLVELDRQGAAYQHLNCGAIHLLSDPVSSSTSAALSPVDTGHLHPCAVEIPGSQARAIKQSIPRPTPVMLIYDCVDAGRYLHAARPFPRDNPRYADSSLTCVQTTRFLV